MRITTIIAATLIATGLSSPGLQAQPLSEARPPAEFPPASFRGSQYVDSRGCVYIRAGIDGNVTWVPRVTRQRQQVCGFQPTLSPAQREAAVPRPARPPAQAPEEITLAPATRPAPSVAAPSVAAPAPPSAQPLARPVSAPVPVATAVQKPPVPAANALPQSTRILRRHVAEARAGAQNIRIPRGYVPVWSDDRLNPRRSEMTLKPSQLSAKLHVPRGYRSAWEDGRLNPLRAAQSAAGQSAMDTLWTQTVPRRLERNAGRSSGVRHDDPAIRGNSPFWQPPAATTAPAVTRLSTRSATAPDTTPQFIRVAHYAKDSDARQTARALAQRGLPVRMGKLQRAGKAYPLVLAGPFGSDQATSAALSRLQAIGFASAKVIR